MNLDPPDAAPGAGGRRRRLAQLQGAAAAPAPAFRTLWSVVSASPPLPQPAAAWLAAAAAVPLDSPSLVLKAGAVPPRTTLVLQLQATDPVSGGTSAATLSLQTSGAPAVGSLRVSPPAGSGLETDFLLEASGWRAARRRPC